MEGAGAGKLKTAPGGSSPEPEKKGPGSPTLVAYIRIRLTCFWIVVAKIFPIFVKVETIERRQVRFNLKECFINDYHVFSVESCRNKNISDLQM